MNDSNNTNKKLKQSLLLKNSKEDVFLQLDRINQTSMETRKRFLTNLPKVELHVHIEGTFEPEMVHLIRTRNKLKITNSIEEMKRQYEQFTNLQSFLDIYYENCDCLLTQDDFYDLCFAFLKKAALEEHIMHVEIFFDPQSHLGRGISLDTIMKGLIKAKKDAQAQFHISVEFICCFLRHLSEEEAFTLLNLILPFRAEIVGFGLDSGEKDNPPEKFKNVVEQLKKMNFRFTAHAGEEGSAENVLSSLTVLKSERIDHGVRVLENDQIVKKCVEDKIGFTICPKSNVRLKVFETMKQHTIQTMMEKGLKLTINSDDPAYFGGYLNANFIELLEVFNFSMKIFYEFVGNAIEVSFISDERKQTLKNMLDLYVLEFVIT